MTKIAKGVECFRFVDWDHLGACAYRRVVVESWGKKQGTIRYMDSGKMAEARVYIHSEAAQFVPVADCPNPNDEATKRAHQLAAKWDAHYLQRINEAAASGESPGRKQFVDLMRAKRVAICARPVNLDDPEAVAAETALTRK